jgi:exodeoxyribonuclease V alpha subunit
MIRGVGPVYAKKLVRAFGENVFDAIEATPDRLREVDGIGPVRGASILAAWAERKIVREIMVFLHAHGIGTARAVRIFKTYGGHAIQVMNGESLPAGSRHPRHWLQDRRRHRHETQD